MNGVKLEDYMGAKEAAQKFGYSYHHFTREKLQRKKVPGAVKQFGRWFIPRKVKKEDILD